MYWFSSQVYPRGKPWPQAYPLWSETPFFICYSWNSLFFKGSFYDQIDGVAMGSPPAPVLASLFMGHHEKIWLEQYQGPEVLFYRHYVDDMFCLGHVHLERFSSNPMLKYWNNSFKYGLLYRFVDLFLTIVFFILSVMHYRRLRKIRETEVALEGDKIRA